MAVVEYGSIVTEIRGKLGSHVFQKCGQLLSMRTQKSQKFSPSVAGQESKRKFLLLTTFWASITPEEKQTFTDAAPTYPTKNKFGNDITLTGYQLYIYINRSLLNFSSFTVSFASAFENIGNKLTGISSLSLGGLSCLATWGQIESDDKYYLFYVSNYLSSDCKRNNPKTKFLTAFYPDLNTELNLYDAIIEKLGRSPVLNQAFYVEVWIQSLQTGMLNRIGVYKIAVIA